MTTILTLLLFVLPKSRVAIVFILLLASGFALAAIVQLPWIRDTLLKKSVCSVFVLIAFAWLGYVLWPPPNFVVGMGGSFVRTRRGLGVGVYVATGDKCDGEKPVLVPVDYMVHVTIVNNKTTAAVIRSYSIEFQRQDGSWEKFASLRAPDSSSKEPTMFWIEPPPPVPLRMSAITPLVSLDDKLRGRALAPGESASGFVYLVFPDVHKPLRDPLTGKMTIVDGVNVDLLPMESDKQGSSNVETTDAIKIGNQANFDDYRFSYYGEGKCIRQQPIVP